MNTTIKLTSETKDKLEKLKLNPKETYDKVVQRLTKIPLWLEEKYEFEFNPIKPLNQEPV